MKRSEQNDGKTQFYKNNCSNCEKTRPLFSWGLCTICEQEACDEKRLRHNEKKKCSDCGKLCPLTQRGPCNLCELEKIWEKEIQHNEKEK